MLIQVKVLQAAGWLNFGFLEEPRPRGFKRVQIRRRAWLAISRGEHTQSGVHILLRDSFPQHRNGRTLLPRGADRSSRATNG